MATYAHWNEVFRRHFFGPTSCGPVYLALDDNAIEELWQTTPALSGQAIAGGVGAVNNLCHAVREDVQARGWLPERAADCLARCCLFVLAYSRVATHERQGAPAYWKHVRHLLDPSRTDAKGYLGPFGLDQPTFQELWARTRDEFGIVLPSLNAADERSWTGPLCNVEIVRSQAGLRQLDLSRVRAMFDESRGKRSLAKLANSEEVSAWIAERKEHLTPYARRVLERNPEVARRQILGEWQRRLSVPDKPESAIDQTTGVFRDVQVQRNNAPGLYLQLEYGRGRLIAYRDDVPLGAEQLATELRRLRNQVWTFDELYERFQARRSAVPGERALLFLEERRLPDELTALTELSATLRCWSPAQLEGLPAGWAMVHYREISRPRSANAFSWVLAALDLRGGLTVERGRWLFGAGPVAIVEGAVEIEMDGQPWPVEDGQTDLSTLPPGAHEVRYGGCVERLEIVPGRRVVDVGNSSRWEWSEGSGWPSLTDGAASAQRSLDGPLFVDIATQPNRRSLTRVAGNLDFAFACRQRPTIEDVGRAHAGRQSETLAFAAVIRGRE